MGAPVHGSHPSGGMPTSGDAALNRQFEDEFEKMYKNDIQKFIEESSFENASLEGLSQISKDSLTKGGSKVKNMEKVYLQRVEGVPQDRPNQPQKNQGTRQKQHFREMGQAQIARAAGSNKMPNDMMGVPERPHQTNSAPRGNQNPFQDMPN